MKNQLSREELVDELEQAARDLIKASNKMHWLKELIKELDKTTDE
jgi:hypothetical protein